MRAGQQRRRRGPSRRSPGSLRPRTPRAATRSCPRRRAGPRPAAPRWPRRPPRRAARWRPGSRTTSRTRAPRPGPCPARRPAAASRAPTPPPRPDAPGSTGRCRGCPGRAAPAGRRRSARRRPAPPRRPSRDSACRQDSISALPSVVSTAARSADGGSRGHQADRAVAGGQRADPVADRQQVAGQPLVQQRRPHRLGGRVDEVDGPARETRRARPRIRSGRPARPCGPGPPAGPPRRSPPPPARRATAATARSRWPTASARPETASAARAAASDAARASVGRRAALQCRASSAGFAAGRRERAGDPLVQRLPLARQDRGVNGLGEQGVPEPEGHRVRVRHQDPVLDRGAQRGVQRRPADRAEGHEQAVRHVAADRRRHPQDRPAVVVDAGHALQDRVAQQAGQRPLAAFGRGEQLLREERVAARARRRSSRSAPRAAPGRRPPPAGRTARRRSAAPGRARRRRRPVAARPSGAATPRPARSRRRGRWPRPRCPGPPPRGRGRRRSPPWTRRPSAGPRGPAAAAWRR